MLPVAFVLLAIGVIYGCSGIKMYPNTMKKNLFVKLKTDSGVSTSLDVYSVDKACQATYTGTVYLDRGRNDIGIPVGKRSFIAFNFARSSFWTGKSRMGHGTLITPKKGMVYKVEAVYENDMYGVEVRESGSLKSKGREVEFRDFSDCKPGK